MKTHLPSGYELASIDPKEFWPVVEAKYKKAFVDRRMIDIESMLSETEKVAIKTNRKTYTWNTSLAFLLKKGDEIIGWHIGDIKEADVFYMRNSAIVAEHRGQKLYEKMLLEILEVLKSKGFQVVTSTHHSNNPQVIIPKLRNGFVISGSEMHERFGFLIHMKYFFNEKRRKSYDAQIGLEI